MASPLLLAWGVLTGPAVQAQSGTDDRARWLDQAIVTQSSTRQRLQVLGDAASCPEARFVTYRRSDQEPTLVDQWYVASQLWADISVLESSARNQAGVSVPAVLAPVPSPAASQVSAEARCHIEKGYVFLDRLWDDDAGGYFPRSNLFGTEVDRSGRYGDDNALAGLSLLDALDQTTDPLQRARYLHAIRREAAFLTWSGLWDDTFGGGFWWHTSKGAAPEGKPAQTNALAALFFARAHRATGAEEYRVRALATLLWLDTYLYDPDAGLYRWAVAFAPTPDGGSATRVSNRFFNYDQGIAIQAQLAAYQLDGDAHRLAIADRVGRSLHDRFWNERGGYNLEAGVDQVFASYAAWTSLGHVALFDQTGEASWLGLVERAVGALKDSLGEPDGGFAHRAYRCVDRIAPGCASPDTERVVDHTRDTASQAWAQHVLAATAERWTRARR